MDIFIRFFGLLKGRFLMSKITSMTNAFNRLSAFYLHKSLEFRVYIRVIMSFIHDFMITPDTLEIIFEALLQIEFFIMT